MELCWQIRKCDYVPGRERGDEHLVVAPGQWLFLGMSCDQNTSDPVSLGSHPQQHTQHGLAFMHSKGAQHNVGLQYSLHRMQLCCTGDISCGVSQLLSGEFYSVKCILSTFLYVSTHGNVCYIRYMCAMHMYGNIFLLPFLCYALGNTQGADESVPWPSQNYNESIK